MHMRHFAYVSNNSSSTLSLCFALLCRATTRPSPAPPAAAFWRNFCWLSCHYKFPIVFFFLSLSHICVCAACNFFYLMCNSALATYTFLFFSPSCCPKLENSFSVCFLYRLIVFDGNMLSLCRSRAHCPPLSPPR